MEHRSLPVPDGLDGTRVDAGLAKLLGFSRTLAAEIASAGGVVLDGSSVDKSDRLRAGSWLEVSWEPPRTLAAPSPNSCPSVAARSSAPAYFSGTTYVRSPASPCAGASSRASTSR